MKNINLFLILCLLCLTKYAQAQQIEISNLKKHIYYLADDKMKGRGTGSKEVFKAADYIEKEFKKYKLQPKGENGYRQSFKAKVWKVKVADSIRDADNIIGFIDNGAALTVVIGAHYDHLGTGHQGSSKDSLGVGKIHNGVKTPLYVRPAHPEDACVQEYVFSASKLRVKAGSHLEE